MPFVPHPTVARLVFNLERGSDSFVNVMYCDPGAALGEAALAVLAQTAYTIYADTILVGLSQLTQLVGVDAYSMASDSAPVGRYVAATPAAGTGSGELLPLQCAGVITWRTAGRGRSARGRSYISGWAEAQSSENALTQAARDLLQTSAQAFRSAFEVDENPLVVYSQWNEGDPRLVGQATLITAAEVRTGVFGSQRDRNRREATA